MDVGKDKASEGAAPGGDRVEPAAVAPLPQSAPAQPSSKHPLSRFDDAWTRLEAKLALWVLFSEMAALLMWVSLKGMSADYKPGVLDAEGVAVPADTSGLAFRGVFSATVLGLLAYRLTRSRKERDRTIAVTVAVLAGAVGSRFWSSAGSEYFSNLLNWMQTASLLTLFGGLRGLVTRLTLWLALLGASLATGQGKHINVDVAMRFLSPKLRVPVAVLGWMAAAAVCASGAVGFFDHIAIEGHKVRATVPCPADPAKDCDKTFGAKFAEVKVGLSNDLFLAGRQISLDAKTLPVVLGGHKYNEYMRPAEWNAWLKGAAWTSHFSAGDVEAQLMDEASPAATRLPVVNVPGTGENTNGLLVRDVDFIFPFGLIMIALRFVMRSLLAIFGLVSVDPDAVHGDVDIEKHHAPKEAA
jgi:hypothetical protein